MPPAGQVPRAIGRHARRPYTRRQMRDPALFAIVLAAGAARRFGDVKQLALYRGTALVVHAVRAAEAACGTRTLLVTGHAGEAVRAACAPLAGFFVHNEAHAEGMGGSIACGTAAVAGAADGVLLMLADQPLVGREHLRRLAAYWRAAPGRAVGSRYAGVAGVPAIFPASDFAALRALRGDVGARAVLAAHGATLATVDCPAAATDVDRPADLAALTRDDA